MKKIFSIIITVVAVLTLASCNDHVDVRPGLWSELDLIETYPGDTVLLSGQASNYIGLKSLSFRCDAWGINQVYSLDGKHSKVFNYNYRMPVPENATFDQVLIITVTDTEGTETKRAITMTFTPDAEAPEIVSDLPAEVGVDFKDGSAVYKMNLVVRDDRRLKKAVISIPSASYEHMVELSGKEANIYTEIPFTAQGTYPMTLTLEDNGGNQTIREVKVIVMQPEVDNGYEDYKIMWLVNADENADDYIEGYYMPMARKETYCYEGKFYADHDNFKIYFTTDKTMDGDLFGSSPRVSGKIINNNGYVVPLTIESKGYYGIWLNIEEKTISLWPLDTSEAYTGSLTVSGCGFKEFGDWGNTGEEMSRNGFVYKYQLTQNGSYTGTHCYYAARVSDWGYILRYWKADDGSCGWWEDKTNGGGSVCEYSSTYDGKVEIMFNTGILWGSMKKVK